jgi:methyl-accepting chemotaxis protein
MRFLLACLVSAAMFVAAGCGGGGSSGTSATVTEAPSGAQAWANSVCQAVTSWNSAITSAGASLKDNPTEEGLRSAADQIRSATKTLSDDLKGLDAPDTENSQEAKAATDELATELEHGLNEITSAVDEASGVSGALTAISAVSSTLVTMGDQVSSTVQRLEQIDAQGELGDAFVQSEACNGLGTTTSGS